MCWSLGFLPPIKCWTKEIWSPISWGLTVHGSNRWWKKIFFLHRFTVVQSLSHVWLFATPWTAGCQASLFFTISWSLLKLMSVESMMPSNHLILCHPFLFLPSNFLSSGVFSNESALRIRWPKDWRFSFTIPQLIVLLSLRICFQTNCWKAIPWIKHKVPQE